MLDHYLWQNAVVGITLVKLLGFHSFGWKTWPTHKLFCRIPSFTQLIPESLPLASLTHCHYLSFCPNLHSLFSPLLLCLSSPLLCFIYQFHSFPTFICIICFSDSSPSSLYIKFLSNCFSVTRLCLLSLSPLCLPVTIYLAVVSLNKLYFTLLYRSKLIKSCLC